MCGGVSTCWSTKVGRLDVPGYVHDLVSSGEEAPVRSKWVVDSLYSEWVLFLVLFVLLTETSFVY